MAEASSSSSSSDGESSAGSDSESCAPLVEPVLEGIDGREGIGGLNEGLVVLPEHLMLREVLYQLVWEWAASTSSLVILLNVSSEDVTVFNARLGGGGGGATALVQEVDSTKKEHERTTMYERGGVLSITNTVLLGDMLRAGQLPPGAITGFIVNNAHKVTAFSQEAFALTLYRKGSRLGWVKALTDRPVRLTEGFSKCQQVMQHLFVTDLYLWPLMRSGVRAALKSRMPTSTKVVIEMDDITQEIHNKLHELMLVQAKKVRSDHSSELHDLVIDDDRVQPLHSLLRTRLESVWHAVSKQTRDYIYDIGVFYRLLIALVTQPPLTFHEVFMAACSNARERHSVWYGTVTGVELIELDERRIYAFTFPHLPLLPQSYTAAQVQGLLSQCRLLARALQMRKWTHLRHLLTSGSDIPAHAKTLIVSRDTAGMYFLHRYLSTDWAEVHAQAWEQFLRRQRDQRGVTWTQEAGGENVKRDDMRRFLERRTLAAVVAQAHERREKEEAAATVVADSGVGMDVDITAYLDDRDEDEEEEEEEEAKRKKKKKRLLPQPNNKKKKKKHKPNNKDKDDDDDDDSPLVYLPVSANAFVCSASETEACLSLLRPSHIVLVDPTKQAMRAVLCAAALDAERCIERMFYLFYKGGVDQEQYDDDNERERAAFLKLIDDKAEWSHNEEQSGRHLFEGAGSDASGNEHKEAAAASLHAVVASGSMRQGGGSAPVQTPQVVIVDQRELRSSLPFYLYKNKFKIVPKTLTIGDYVITPRICIERKSLADLEQSITKGRLFDQMRSMCHSYECPVLLIEFDARRPFGFTAASRQSAFSSSSSSFDASFRSSIESRVVLLTVTFPRMRIIWSHGPQMTTEIIASLKHGQQQPQVDMAQRLGTDDAPVDAFALNPHHILELLVPYDLRLTVTNRYHNLQEVSRASREELVQLLGRVAGTKLFDMFHDKRQHLADELQLARLNKNKKNRKKTSKKT